MCFSQGVSLVTYIVVMIIAIVIFFRNKGSDRHIALFIMAFVTIQYLEAHLWDSIQNGNMTQNDLVTRLVLMCLWFQPVVNTIGAASNASSKNGFLFLSGIFVVFVVMFWNAMVTASQNVKFETVTGPNCHLVWNRHDKDGKVDPNFMSDFGPVSAIYLLGLFLPMLFIRPVKKAVFLTILGGLTLFMARKFSSAKETSSWWCWVAGVWAFGALIT